MNNKISIIVPIYNCEKYVDKCIKSILNQTYKNYEILLIDDGSTDNSYSICKNYEEKYASVRVFHKNNGGVSSARNYGLEKAIGNYILFVDSDDTIHKKHCELLLENLIKYDADMSSNAISINEYDLSLGNPKLISKDDALYKVLFDMNFFGYPVNKLYKKSIINQEQILNFDEKIHWGEDLLFNVNYILRCKRIVQDYNKTYYYYQNEESRTNKSNLDKKSLSLLESCSILTEVYSRESKINEGYAWIFYFNSVKLLKERKCNKEQRKLLNREENKTYRKIIKNNRITLKMKAKVFAYHYFKVLYVALNKVIRLIKG